MYSIKKGISLAEQTKKITMKNQITLTDTTASKLYKAKRHISAELYKKLRKDVNNGNLSVVNEKLDFIAEQRIELELQSEIII